jgi:hypothetical protein
LALVPVARQAIVNVQAGANMAEKRLNQARGVISAGTAACGIANSSRAGNLLITAALHMPALSARCDRP